jgi:hypothetical protein
MILTYFEIIKSRDPVMDAKFNNKAHFYNMLFVFLSLSCVFGFKVCKSS